MTDRPWSLATIERTDGTTACVALTEDGPRRLPQLDAYPGVFKALQHWAELETVLRDVDPRAGTPVGGRVVAPLRYPRCVLCSGSNYRDHLAEMTNDAGRAVWPFFFLKPPVTTVIGPGEPIVIDPDPAQQVDWEAELGVVIGRPGRHIAVDDALSHVAGYTIVNDVSARGPHHRTDAFAPPFAWDWLASKGQDTFCPIGPGVTPAWLIDDPHKLPIRLTVNGVERQRSNTDQMILSVADLIAAASRMLTLSPGDLIATGTPAGVGLPTGTFLRPGDVVDIELGPLGVLRNPVIARINQEDHDEAVR